MLVVVGIKMLISRFHKILTWISLLLIASILSDSLIASFAKPAKRATLDSG